jgi:hypothetical protein
LTLSRETLRDLTPDAADAAAVQGGATVADPGCHPKKSPARQTTIVAPPVPPPESLEPGRYRIERRAFTDFEVLENGEVVVHDAQVEDDDPKPLG